MIWTNTKGVIGEVLFNDSGTKSDSTKHGDVTRRVIRQTKRHIWIQRSKLRKHAKVDVLNVFNRSGVVGVALHQHDGHARCSKQIHGAMNILK